MNNKPLKVSIFFLLFLLLIACFKSWFSFDSLSTGDWHYKFPQAIRSFSLFPYVWDASFLNGLGGNIAFLLPLNTYFLVTTSILFSHLHIPWELVEKIIWFWPFLFISLFGSFILFKRLILDNSILACLSSLIFSTNTYILMVVGGGQLGVGMGYALIPLVVWCFLVMLEKNEKQMVLLQSSVVAGLVFSIQLLFDPRLAYITIIFLTGYYLIYVIQKEMKISLLWSILYYFIIPVMVTCLIHAVWLIPFVMTGKNPLYELGEAYTGIGMVKFLSFATFENTFSLLHPYWPQNIFGKITFMKPEFLLLPMLTFFVLFFIQQDIKRKKILALSLLALLGVFLAKGANEPFGIVYLWLFEHIPGFNMFRDATKWYGIVALTFSLLIPYALYKIASLSLLTRIKKYSFFLLVSVFIVFWGFLIRQALGGQLGGTFSPRQVPSSYQDLTTFISSQPRFFRVLWFPQIHQFTYYSYLHPVIPGASFFSSFTSETLAKKIEQQLPLLGDAGVKYLVIPEDIDGKIFLNDRKYDEALYKRAIALVESIPSFKRVKTFGKIVVFELSSPKDHFWTDAKSMNIHYIADNPVTYNLKVQNAKKGDRIVFSESFDPHWRLYSPYQTVYSQRYHTVFNSFILPESGNYSLRLYYQPQDWVNIGLLISVGSIISISIFLSVLLYKNVLIRKKNKKMLQ